MNGKAMASAWVGLTTLGQPRLSEGAQPYLKTGGCDVIASLPDPPPATRVCHPPPETLHLTFAPRTASGAAPS